MEIWKDIKGYNGLYEVSSYGNIRSLDRMIRCRNNHFKKIQGKYISPIYRKDGYLEVNLWKDNIQEQCLLHRLVAETFLPNPNNLPEVNHIDGNKENNYVDNLEWVTKSENMQHAVKTGLTHNQRKIVKNNNILLKSKPVLKYDLQGNFIEEYPSVSYVCKQFGYAQGAISNVCRGERTKAYGYIWKYKGDITNEI